MLEVPHVKLSETRGGWNAAVVYRLRSLRPALDSQASGGSLLGQALDWHFPVNVELSRLITPSLTPNFKPVSQILLTVNTQHSRKGNALENALQHSFAFQPLVESCWPHAVFCTTDEPSNQFWAQSRVALGRQTERIALEPPFPKCNSIGLLPRKSTPYQGREFLCLRRFWSPAPQLWPTLLNVLTRSPARHAISVCASTCAAADRSNENLEAQLRSIETRFGGPGFTPAVTTAYAALQQRRADLASGGAFAFVQVTLASSASADVETVARLLGAAVSGPINAATRHGGFSFGLDAEPFTLPEAVSAFNIPDSVAKEGFGLPVSLRWTAPAPPMIESVDSQGTSDHRILLGTNRHGNRSCQVTVPVQHLLTPTLIAGTSGCGKSTMMLNIAREHARLGHGFCFVDPHGDAVEHLLSTLPPSRIKDVLLLELDDDEYVIPFNLIAANSYAEQDVCADELLAALLRTYRDPSMFGAVFERHFRGMLRLLATDPDNTLLELPLLFSNEAFRQRLLNRAEDPILHDFVREAEGVKYGDGKLENIAPYITCKLGRFFHDRLLRRMTGHGAMAIPFRRAMDEHFIVIVKLARGRVGHSVANLIASQLARRFQLAAMTRADVAPEQRRPFFLLLDEFGSVADESFVAMLSETRKYGVGLTVAVQFLSQLRDRNATRDLLPAVLGNAGTLITFRVSPDDAAILAASFSPLAPAELINLADYKSYVRLFGGGSDTPFNLRVRHAGLGSISPAHVRQCSRGHWSVTVAECDARIADRRSRLARQDIGHE